MKKQKSIEIEGWVARDRNGRLNFYVSKPKKTWEQWCYKMMTVKHFNLNRILYPSVKWSDASPTPATIRVTLK